MEPYQLQSGCSVLSVEARTGRIALLQHQDKTFLPAATGTGPLRLHQPLPDFEAHLLDAAHTQPVITRQGETLEIVYANLLGARGATDISARVTIRAVGDDTYALRATVTNGGAFPIPQLFFPYISGFLPFDGSEDQITYGKSRFQPRKMWSEVSPDRRMTFLKYASRPELWMSVNWAYQAGMKWMDLGGKEHGVTLFSTEKTSATQFMRVSSETRYAYPTEYLDLSWVHYPFLAPGETWDSAEFILYPHADDWHRGVLKYRDFASRTYATLPSTPERDATIGQYSFWMSWHYQDWQDVKFTYRDIPAIAAEARAAGFRELTLARATKLDFCLPHVIREQLGTLDELKAAVAASRQLGVNITPFVTCKTIRENTIRADQRPAEWFAEDAAHHHTVSNWSYHPTMTPDFPIQLTSRAGLFTCPGSRGWQQAFFDFLDEHIEAWGYAGLMFDQSLECNYICFNPLHDHRPDQITTILSEVMAETRRRLAARCGTAAALSGEAQWDAATEWMDFTWEWTCFDTREELAPFTMAFPRARQCLKCTDYLPQILRIFIGGYWLDLWLEEGEGRLPDYPELARFLPTLATFKARFSRFFNQRDAYLHTLGTACADANVWVRGHRSGDEVLVLAADADGAEKTVEVTLDVRELLGGARGRYTVWSRSLERLAEGDASEKVHLMLNIPSMDFVAVHLAAIRGLPSETAPCS